MAYLTIIIPHKNSFESLIRLLGTIPDEIDLIVVDDKSETETQKRLLNIGYSNVRVLFNTTQESNAGHARNIGIEAVSDDCEWIMFSDADDLMNKENLSALLEHLKSERADVVLCNVDAVWEDGSFSKRADYIEELLSKFPDNREEILFWWVGPIGKVIRKNIIDENKLRFESRIASNDVVFATRLAALKPAVSKFNRIIYTIIQNKNSLTATINVEKAKDRLEATWIRNDLIRACQAKVRLLYGVTWYKNILVHGSIVDAMRYLPKQLKNMIIAVYGNCIN
jgi:glycosyltransferase involved in cell wall biosynthesis